MLLEPANPKMLIEINLLEIDLKTPKTEYNIKKILDQQEIDSQIKYLIKWKSYKHHNNT